MANKILTLSEYCRKYNVAKYVLSKNKKLFKLDPGYDTPKFIDNAFNKKVLDKLEETRQKRPNAKGEPKPRKEVEST
jgi:hypothetical protein